MEALWFLGSSIIVFALGCWLIRWSEHRDMRAALAEAQREMVRAPNEGTVPNDD